MVKRWAAVNILTVLIVIVWSIIQGFDSNMILLAKLLSQVAFLLFLVNINMYFVFLIIRKSKNRKIKIKLAKLSKHMMKYHIAIAATAVLLISAHGALMFWAQIENPWNAKTLTGMIAVFALCLVLFSGLLRHFKSSGLRRKFHYITAFVFFSFVLIHIFG